MRDGPSRRGAHLMRFLRGRLSPEGYLGLHLTIGMIVILLGCWWFGGIAEDLGPDEKLVAFDHQVMRWFGEQVTPPLTIAARAISFFGSAGFLMAASAGIALIFFRRRAWDHLGMLGFTMVGGSLLNILLKHLFHRQRPILENPFVTLTSFGFPSGHTMGATLFYGAIALWAGSSIKSWRWRVIIFVAASFMVTAIGMTRIYLGAHFLSDVLAAIAAGVVWLALCWTAIETFRKRRAHLRRG